MYWFARAVVTKYQGPSGVNKEMYWFTILEARSLNEGGGRSGFF